MNAFIQVLGSALSIWDSKEKSKYVDRYMKLKKEWYAEENKPESQRDHAVIDNLEFELRLLGIGFATEAAKSNAVPQS